MQGATLGSPRIEPTMTLLVAAIAATVAAMFESTITQYLRVGDGAQPHLVFVLAVIWTVAAGLDSGLVWAFVGGIALDTLAQRPLGTTAFALLIVVGATSAIARPLARLRPIVAIIATALLSLVYSMTLVLLFSVLRPPAALTDPLRIVLPSVAYDVLVAAILGPLIVSIRDRFADEERVAR
jgi:rod shape-determining protein MreD